MINFLLFLLFIACLGITAAWVAENPGIVTIHWFDWRIDTSVAFLLLMGTIACIALAYAFMLIRRVIVAPGRISQSRSLKAHRRGLAELTHSVAALAAADIKTAEQHTRKAEKLLGRTPLTLLLSAQIARSRGDDVTTKLMLTQMLDHKETEYLAARSLSDAASRQQLFPKALELAERAHAVNPADAVPVIGLHVRLGQWQQAMQAIAKSARRGHISRNAMRHYRGIVHLAQGKQLLEAGRHEEALVAARSALKERPNFTPTTLLAARAYAAGDQELKASRLILRAWKRKAHPHLADAMRSVTAHLPKEKQAKLLGKLGAPAPAEGGWSWVCSGCGHAVEHWQAHCPNCNAFDTLEWKKRELKFVA